MPTLYQRKYGAATTLDFELYELDGTDLQQGAVSASGDVTLNRDEAVEETLDADAFVDEGKSYSLALSAAEMTAARIIVHVIDQTGPKAWLDKVLIVETYGHASAQHAFDLDTATQNVNVASIDNIDFGATMKASINTEVDSALNTAVPGVPTADSINERVKTVDDAYTAARGAYLDELAAANIPADIDTLLARLTALRAGYLDELAAANIPADVDTLLGRLTALRAGYLDELDFDLTARLGTPAGLSLAADLLTIDNLVDDLEGRLTAARAGYLDNLVNILKIGKNRWKMTGNQLIIYDDDALTPLYTLNLLDSAGVATMTDVYERTPV